MYDKLQMKRWGTILVFFLFLLATGATAVFSQQPVERSIVVFKESLTTQQKQELISRVGATFGKDLKLINAAAVTLPPSVKARLAQLPQVNRIDPDVEVEALERPEVSRAPEKQLEGKSICDWIPTWPGCSPQPTPTPTPTPTPSVAPTATPTPTPTPVQATASSQTTPWGITRIGAPDAWSLSVGSGVKVGVIDTGIDTDHPDVNDNLAGCVNFIQSWKTCEDDNGHGTHVSGIIAAEQNTIGVVGVAPQARIYSLKVLDRRGRGYLSDIIEALDWSINHGIQVVNMSLGTSSDVQSFRDAVARVNAAGVVQVAAAGNSGPGANTVNYPAKYSEVIAVAATDSSDGVPSWSSRGPEVDIAAPGASINSTYYRNTYKVLSGTSMASPHVAGTVALRLFLRPTETPLQLETLLESGASPLPFDATLVGAGLVNSLNVVSAP